MEKGKEEGSGGKQTDESDAKHKYTKPTMRRGIANRGRQQRGKYFQRYHRYPSSETDLSELSSNLKDLFLSGEDSDIVIAVKDQKFPVHRAILRVRSPMFNTMLNCAKQSENHGVVKIDDCDPRIFRHLLSFLYSGKFAWIAAEDGFELFLLSGKYEVKGLMDHTVGFVAQNLALENVGEVLSLAVKHDMSSVLPKATDYFVRNAEGVLLTSKWLSFVRCHPLDANNLFMRVLASRTDEEDTRSESGASEIYLTPPEEMNPNETPVPRPTDYPEHKDARATSLCYPEKKSLDLLSANLRKLFLDYEDSDVTFKVKNCFYPAHRNILRVQSPVFCELIGLRTEFQQSSQNSTKEDDSKMVEITDCEPLDFRDFLLYLYSGKSDCISGDNVFELFDMAKAYCVEGLKGLCVQYLERNLTSELVGDALSLAVKHGEESLLKSAGKFFVENAVSVLPTTEWRKFVKTNPVEANELFTKALERYPAR